jgi:hypothetical protein
MKTLRILFILVIATALTACQGPFGFSVQPIWIGGPPIYGGSYCRPQYQPRYYYRPPSYGYGNSYDYGCYRPQPHHHHRPPHCH